MHDGHVRGDTGGYDSRLFHQGIATMSHDRIHEPPLMVHMLIDGLNRYDERPCLFIGDTSA